MNKDYAQLLKLLDADLTAENEKEHLESLQDLMGPPTAFELPKDFTNKVMEEVEMKKDELMGKVVYLFKRVALSGAAAIVLLIAYSWFVEGTISPDSLLGISYLEDAAFDIRYTDSF